MSDAKHLDTNTYPRHIPVLLQETYEYLVQENSLIQDSASGTHLDCNFGDAGHVEYFAEQAHTHAIALTIHAVDADQYAIDRGTSFLKTNKAIADVPVIIHKGNFKDIDALIPKNVHFTSVLFDLGLSTYQLGPSHRGFSFKYDESLDMRFDSDEIDSQSEDQFTAYDIVNFWSPDTISLILKNYADESRAWKIATAIEQARTKAPIASSKQLADLLIAVLGENKKTGIHPATKTFQALRIAVNNEIQILTEVFTKVLRLVASGGRIGVISYHSLEDSVTKRQFKEWEEGDMGKRVNKKIIIPTEVERKQNPRSRSAKFRVFQKNN
mgnify:CR=1 FL=1